VGKFVEGCPQQMNPVTVKNNEIYRNSITLTWKTLNGYAAGGKTLKIIKFQIRMKEAKAKHYKRKNSWSTKNL